MRLDDLNNSRVITVAVVYLSLFLDNVLLTVVGNYEPNWEKEAEGTNHELNNLLIRKCFSADYPGLSVHARREYDRERRRGRKRSSGITPELEGSGPINFESRRGHSHRYSGLRQTSVPGKSQSLASCFA